MKRLLSLLLVIAMLFSVCTVFTACDSSSSVSDEDEDEDDDDKKKEDKDDEDEEDDVEPTLVLNGLKIVLPEDFELVNKNINDETANAEFTNDCYTVYISCGPMEDEIEGMDAEEMRDYILDQMDPEDSDSDVGEYDSGTKNKTPYIYAIKGDETMAMAMSFYADGDYAWTVRVLSSEDSEDYSVEEMIDLITGWKCSAPKPGEEEDPDEEENQRPNESRPPENDQPIGDSDLDESVIYNDHGITVSVTGVETSYSYYTFNLEVENNSGMNVNLGADHCVVNGVSTVYCSFYGEANDGETTEASLMLSLSTLEAMNIDRVGDVEFNLYIYDETYDYVEEGTRVSIQTDDAGYRHTVDDSGVTIFDEAGIRIVVQDIQIADAYDSNMYLYVENNASEPLRVNLENIIINGWVLPFASGHCTVMPGTNTIEMMDIAEVLVLGITHGSQIENMIYNLDIYNSQTYSTYYAQDFLSYCPGDASFVQDVDVSGFIVYDNNGIEIRVLGTEEGNSYVTYQLYVRNTNNQALHISLADAVVNGVSSYDSEFFYMAPNTQAIGSLDLWFNSEAGFNSLADLESVVVSLDVSDVDYRTLWDGNVILLAE